MNLKNYLNFMKIIATIFVGNSNIVNCAYVGGDNANATTFIYANPYDSESNNPSMSYLRTMMSANSRTARRGGGSGSLSNSCLTNEGASGTCMSRFNCMRLGGTVKGSCPTFSGICCETNLQCDQPSRLKRTIIRNPAQIPTTDCLYTIEAYSSNVCQLLVEFENFQLQPPILIDSLLECLDYIEIGKYKLCGLNDGQHLYLPFNVAGGIRNVPINFRIQSGWRETSWRLIVTQLECPAVKRRMNLSFLPFVTDNSLQDARTVFSLHNSDWDILAPPGCDQYYRQTRGTIKSFNFNENNAQPTYYMRELNYVICIKPMPGATMIEYTVRRFSLRTAGSETYGFDQDCHSVVSTVGRSDDFLMIPQSRYTSSLGSAQPVYYCGLLPSGSTAQADSPFIMYFQSDDFTDTDETGFSIDYSVKSVLG